MDLLGEAVYLLLESKKIDEIFQALDLVVGGFDAADGLFAEDGLSSFAVDGLYIFAGIEAHHVLPACILDAEM